MSIIGVLAALVVDNDDVDYKYHCIQEELHHNHFIEKDFLVSFMWVRKMYG